MFQFGQLVPELTTADNVALPLLLNRTRRRAAYQTAGTWLDRLGLGDKGARTGPASCPAARRSGSRSPRALALAPTVIFADEPTGSLDSLTGEKVMDLMIGLAREQGTTVVLVTHDARVAAYADRVVMVRDGLGHSGDGEASRRRAAISRQAELMLRLGLQLTLRSGREALVRLVITAAAVAVGVALLLGVLAEFHAFQANASQPCWSCTTGAPVPATLPAHGELWNDSVDFYQGQTITRLDVAALGAGRTGAAGHLELPAAGEYYASPALAALLQHGARRRARRPVPRATGRDDRRRRAERARGAGHLHRVHARRVHRITPPKALNAIGGTRWVTSIVTAPRARGVHPVLPVRVRGRRAGGAVPDAGADQHGHPAGGGPSGGAVRRAPAGRGDARPTSGRSRRWSRW